MNTTEALKMVEGIPKENFIEGLDTDGVDKCCFLGHHSRLTSYDPTDYDDSNCDGGRFSDIFESSQLYLQSQLTQANSIMDINDYDIYPPYTEPEIKDRLIHFLTDMIKAGY